VKSMPFIVLATFVAFAQAPAPPTPPPAPIIGRWDLTVHGPGGDRSSWLEVRHSGLETLIGQFVGTSGSARPISRVDFKDGEFHFTIPPQWDRVNGDLVVAGRIDADRLKGTMKLADRDAVEWTGVRAPSLRRAAEPQWDTPVRLFTGNDLTGWHAMGTNEWEAAGGMLHNRKSGANLVTDRTFDDFKLHVEFKYPKGSNSGVYLRGRYEVQIEDDERDDTGPDVLGAVYGFLAPNQRAAKKADEWQTFDITLVGRLVSVVLNGKRIICEQEIPGITGAALDSKEGEPGPLLLQGDHGPIDYRNMMLTPAKHSDSAAVR
jgi:3-keto-disaccharide hydrolase